MLSGAKKDFVLYWGEIGCQWGVTKSVAQLFALLYLSPKPMNAEEMAEALSMARSNVSMGIRELQSWRLIKTVHVLGDRREHFETLKDVWEMFLIVLDERRRREIEPGINALKGHLTKLEEEPHPEKEAALRIRELADFFETMNALHAGVRSMAPKDFKKLVKSAHKAQKLLAAMV